MLGYVKEAWSSSLWYVSELIGCYNFFLSDLVADKLEWGNSDQINAIVQRYPEGFDLVLGADIYILIFLF